VVAGIKKINITRIYIALFGTAIFLFAIRSLDDFDTWYHLATGRLVSQTVSLPISDTFSYTAEGASWVAHYWLADVIFYNIFATGGALALILFIAAIAAFTYMLALRIALDRGSGVLVGALALGIFYILSAGAWEARPQVFSYICMVALVYVLERWRRTSLGMFLVSAPLIILIWANFHATALFGIIIMSVYVLDVACAGSDKRNVFLAIFALCGGAMLTFVNPYGYRSVFYFAQVKESAQLLNIQEFQPIFAAFEFLEPRIFVLLSGIALGVLIFWVFSMWRRKRLLEVAPLGLAVFAFILPWFAIRFSVLFSFIAAPFVAAVAQQLINRYKFSFNGIVTKNRIISAVLGVAVVAAVLHVPKGNFINARQLPVGATDFIFREHITGNMFNSLALGGYLTWRLWPGTKIFIDGRNEVYAGETTRDYIAIRDADDGFEYLLTEKYKINYVVLKLIPASAVRPFAERLTGDMDFKLVYWDDAAVVFVKDVPDNKNIIDTFAYSVITPFRNPAGISPGEYEVAQKELERAHVIAPASKTISLYATYLRANVPKVYENGEEYK